ncbi:Leucyl/phenylalanyl-tRNA--protein transferase [Gammaproteobacteria bacterium]
MPNILWLTSVNTPFPKVTAAQRKPNGLLAAGGSLTVGRLISAYRQGIFPWYSDYQPILWWSPDPRFVLYPERLKISRSLRQSMRNRGYRVSIDTAFPTVIEACAGPRAGAYGTWITSEMLRAYVALHKAGVAHSVETWQGDDLVGGLYGVSLGRIFCGESMFSRQTDASKVAFAHLVHQLRAWEFGLIDCQVPTEHLKSLGAESISRNSFIQSLHTLSKLPEPPWKAGDLVNSVTLHQN